MVDETVLGTTTYEWLEGRHFVVVRSHVDHELFPDAISIIGRPESGEGLVLEWFDSRGVRRTYELSLENGVVRWWRDHPGFDQRCSGTLGPDEFEIVGERAEAPGEWQADLSTTYRRA